MGVACASHTDHSWLFSLWEDVCASEVSSDELLQRAGGWSL